MKGRHAKLEPASSGEGSLCFWVALTAWLGPPPDGLESAQARAKLWHFLSAGHQGCLWEPLPCHRRATDVGEAEQKREEKRDLGVLPCHTDTHCPPRLFRSPVMAAVLPVLPSGCECFLCILMPLPRPSTPTRLPLRGSQPRAATPPSHQQTGRAGGRLSPAFSHSGARRRPVSRLAGKPVAC